jgi:hypothetical protein
MSSLFGDQGRNSRFKVQALALYAVSGADCSLCLAKGSLFGDRGQNFRDLVARMTPTPNPKTLAIIDMRILFRGCQIGTKYPISHAK